MDGKRKLARAEPVVGSRPKAAIEVSIPLEGDPQSLGEAYLASHEYINVASGSRAADFTNDEIEEVQETVVQAFAEFEGEADHDVTANERRTLKERTHAVLTGLGLSGETAPLREVAEKCRDTLLECIAQCEKQSVQLEKIAGRSGHKAEDNGSFSATLLAGLKEECSSVMEGLLNCIPHFNTGVESVGFSDDAEILKKDIAGLRGKIMDLNREAMEKDTLLMLVSGKLTKRDQTVAYIRKTLFKEVCSLKEELYRAKQMDTKDTVDTQFFSLFDFMKILDYEESTADMKSLDISHNKLTPDEKLKQQLNDLVVKWKEEQIMRNQLQQFLDNVRSSAVTLNERLRPLQKGLLEKMSKIDVAMQVAKGNVFRIADELEAAGANAKSGKDIKRTVLIAVEPLVSSLSGEATETFVQLSALQNECEVARVALMKTLGEGGDIQFFLDERERRKEEAIADYREWSEKIQEKKQKRVSAQKQIRTSLALDHDQLEKVMRQHFDERAGLEDQIEVYKKQIDEYGLQVADLQRKMEEQRYSLTTCLIEERAKLQRLVEETENDRDEVQNELNEFRKLFYLTAEKMWTSCVVAFRERETVAVARKKGKGTRGKKLKRALDHDPEEPAPDFEKIESEIVMYIQHMQAEMQALRSQSNDIPLLLDQKKQLEAKVHHIEREFSQYREEKRKYEEEMAAELRLLNQEELQHNSSFEELGTPTSTMSHPRGFDPRRASSVTTVISNLNDFRTDSKSELVKLKSFRSVAKAQLMSRSSISFALTPVTSTLGIDAGSDYRILFTQHEEVMVDAMELLLNTSRAQQSVTHDELNSFMTYRESYLKWLSGADQKEWHTFMALKDEFLRWRENALSEAQRTLGEKRKSKIVKLISDSKVEVGVFACVDQSDKQITTVYMGIPKATQTEAEAKPKVKFRETPEMSPTSSSKDTPVIESGAPRVKNRVRGMYAQDIPQSSYVVWRKESSQADPVSPPSPSSWVQVADIGSQTEEANSEPVPDHGDYPILNDSCCQTEAEIPRRAIHINAGIQVAEVKEIMVHEYAQATPIRRDVHSETRAIKYVDMGTDPHSIESERAHSAPQKVNHTFITTPERVLYKKVLGSQSRPGSAVKLETEAKDISQISLTDVKSGSLTSTPSRSLIGSPRTPHVVSIVPFSESQKQDVWWATLGSLGGDDLFTLPPVEDIPSTPAANSRASTAGDGRTGGSSSSSTLDLAAQAAAAAINAAAAASAAVAAASAYEKRTAQLRDQGTGVKTPPRMHSAGVGSSLSVTPIGHSRPTTASSRSPGESRPATARATEDSHLVAAKGVAQKLSELVSAKEDNRPTDLGGVDDFLNEAYSNNLIPQGWETWDWKKADVWDRLEMVAELLHQRIAVGRAVQQASKHSFEYISQNPARAHPLRMTGLTVPDVSEGTQTTVPLMSAATQTKEAEQTSVAVVNETVVERIEQAIDVQKELLRQSNLMLEDMDEVHREVGNEMYYNETSALAGKLDEVSVVQRKWFEDIRAKHKESIAAHGNTLLAEIDLPKWEALTDAHRVKAHNLIGQHVRIHDAVKEQQAMRVTVLQQLERQLQDEWDYIGEMKTIHHNLTNLQREFQEEIERLREEVNPGAHVEPKKEKKQKPPKPQYSFSLPPCSGASKSTGYVKHKPKTVKQGPPLSLFGNDTDAGVSGERGQSNPWQRSLSPPAHPMPCIPVPDLMHNSWLPLKARFQQQTYTLNVLEELQRQYRRQQVINRTNHLKTVALFTNRLLRPPDSQKEQSVDTGGLLLAVLNSLVQNVPHIRERAAQQSEGTDTSGDSSLGNSQSSEENHPILKMRDGLGMATSLPHSCVDSLLPNPQHFPNLSTSATFEALGTRMSTPPPSINDTSKSGIFGRPASSLSRLQAPGGGGAHSHMYSPETKQKLKAEFAKKFGANRTLH